MTDVLDVARGRLELLCNEYKAAHNVSEAEVARRMGFTPQKLGKLLSLQLRIGLSEARQISDFFDVSIAWIAGESEIRQKLTPEMQTAVNQLLNSRAS